MFIYWIISEVSLFFSLQLDKIVEEKEARFNKEKNDLWKELTDAFQKVFSGHSL